MKKTYWTILMLLCSIILNAQNEYLEPSSTVGIHSDQIGDDGIVNYNTSTDYSFYTDIPLQNYQWRFEIQKTDGDFEQISTGTSASFSICLPQIKDSYYQVSSGQIIGRIHAEGLYLPTQNTLTEDYPIHINYQPETPFFQIAEIIPVDEYQAKIIFKLFARGAVGYSLTIEDGYFGNTFSIPEAGYIEYTYPDIYNEDNYIFTLSAYNEFGSSEAIIYYNPSGGTNIDILMGPQVLDDSNLHISFYDKNGILHNEINLKSGKIINSSGYIVETFTSLEEVSISSLKAGFYILQVSDEAGKTYISKFYKP